MAYETDPVIPPLTVRTAANRLGMSTWGVHKAIDRGELTPVVRHPIKVSADDVEQMRLRKRDEAIARLGADRLARVAKDVRGQLHPHPASGAPRGHAALEHLSEVVKAALGMPLLHGAAMPDGSGCRWCAAVVAGRMLGATVRPDTLMSEIGIALLGGPECDQHRGMLRTRMDRLAARVHPGGTRPSGARAASSAASGRVRAPEAAAPRPRPAERVQGDDGKGLVARRLRETRARLKMARRSGDRPYSLRLAQMVRDLEADAAAVTAAAARPGRLRCGHALASGCSCPRRASTRGRR